MKSAAYIQVSGRVQGVGYRYFALRNGELLGLSGYVKNCPDGSVELEVEGERGVIDQYIKILREGPKFSQVRALDFTFKDYEAKYNHFSVEY
jgi:acylphosphatase